MRVYYSNTINAYGSHDILRTWGGNQGRPRPEDLVASPLDGTYSFIEVDALANRKLCAELARGWMPKPHFQVTGPYDPTEVIVPMYVNSNSKLCYQDGSLVTVNDDPHKSVVEAFPAEAAAFEASKAAEIQHAKDLGQDPPKPTPDQLQAQIDDLRRVVKSIVARNSLAEWKG